MDIVKPSELRTAARVADALVYAAGVAGVIAGGLLFQGDQLPLAILAWVLTFIAGAVLRLAAWAARALAELLQRTDRIERSIDDLRTAQPAPPPQEPERSDRIPDPYRRWGGFH
jgi:hypothetical protein